MCGPRDVELAVVHMGRADVCEPEFCAEGIVDAGSLADPDARGGQVPDHRGGTRQPLLRLKTSWKIK